MAVKITVLGQLRKIGGCLWNGSDTTRLEVAQQLLANTQSKGRIT
jgi:hypothetical protein